MPTPATGVPLDQRAAQRPFVGRRAELELLRQHLGRGRLIVVTGEPGIGKTRLVEEFAGEAEAYGALVCWGRCWEGEGAPAFWPWIQILREQAGVDATAEREIARLLHEVAGRSQDPSDASPLAPAPSRFQLFDEVTTTLTRAAAVHPMVLVLEDLHWADVPSLRLLQFVVRHARKAPLLVIATYRNVEVGKAHPLAEPLRELTRHGEPMPLAGLDASAVERYVAATLGAERARALAARLHRETEGHPFFLVELVRLLEAGSGAAGLPDGIRDLIGRRLRAHSEPCQAVLRVAAVVGRDFPLTVLRRLPTLADHDLLAALDEALDGRLIALPGNESESYRFSHALVRDALYEDLPLARRVQLHREIGEVIEVAWPDDDAHTAELAHHFLEAAAEGDAEPAIHHGIRAGEIASRMLAHEDAVAHYERVQRLLERAGSADEARLSPVLIALGLAQVRAGDPTGAETSFARAAAVARRHALAEDLSRAALGLGEIERTNDRLIPILEEALALLDDADSVLRARLLSRLSVALYWSQPEARKRALSDEAVAMARRLGYVPTLAYALSSRIAALSGPEDIEQRLAASTEMVALGEQCDQRELVLIARGWSIADALALGDIHRVRFGIETFATLAGRLRHPYYAWWLSAFHTMLAILEGRLAEAETLAQESFTLGQRAVATDAAQVFAGHCYVLWMEGARYDQVEVLVRGIVDQFPDVPGGRCILALLHVDRGRVAEATAAIDALAAERFVALPRNPEWLSSIAALAQTSALLPTAPHAATLYELLLPHRGRIIVAGMGVLCSGAVDHFLGILATRLGRLDAAATHLEDAITAYERIGAHPWRAYSLYESAILALARRGDGDLERAAALADEARGLAETHGMVRLQRFLAALEVPVAAVRPATPAARREGLLRKEGDYWCLAWDGNEFRLRERLGLHYLAILIGSPRREFLATDLVRLAGGRGAAAEMPEAPAREDAGAPRELVNAEATLDPSAELAYRHRLDELKSVLAEARRHHDLGRIAAAEAETDAITHEIARSLGLGSHGRDSRSPIERARVSVTRAIRMAMRLIQDNDPGYGRHLAVTVKTGTFCSYVPDPELRVTWKL